MYTCPPFNCTVLLLLYLLNDNLLLFYFVIVNPHQNLRHIFSIFHLSECVIERITLSHIQGCISRRFHFDELQNNKRIRNQEEASMGKAEQKSRTAVRASYRRRIFVPISEKGSIDTDYFISLFLWLRAMGWTC